MNSEEKRVIANRVAIDLFSRNNERKTEVCYEAVTPAGDTGEIFSLEEQAVMFSDIVTILGSGLEEEITHAALAEYIRQVEF